MTSNYHTPIPSSPKQPANAATVNAPLAELDAELTAQDARIVTLEGDSPPYSGVASEFLNGEGDFAVPAGTGSTNGHVIQDAGSDVTQRAKLNFTGSGVSVSDTPTATEVEITANLPATTAANDVVVGDGAGAWIKKTLAELLTILGVTATPTASKIPQADANGRLHGWVDMFAPLSDAEISITGATTLTVGRVHVISGSSNYSCALPTAVGAAGKFIGARFTNTGITTIDPDGAQTIDGVATRTYYQGQTVILMSDGSNWYTINQVVVPRGQLIMGSQAIGSTALTKYHDAAYDYGYAITATTAADGVTIDFGVYVAKGTYTVTVSGGTTNSRGKLDWTLNGVSQTTAQDWYSSSTVYNAQKTFTLTVPYSGWHVLRATVNGKNASSSNYNFSITSIDITPSAY